MEDWCHNLRIDAASLVGQEPHVCERHFEAHCFNADKLLRQAARPTLYLGHDDLLDVLPNPAWWEEEAHVCVVPSCGRSKDGDNVQLFGLPKAKFLLDKWLQNFRLDPSKVKVKGRRICSVHFEPSCIDSDRLHIGAMPTLHLGHDETDNIHESIKELPVMSRIGHTRIHCDCCYPNCVELKNGFRKVNYDLPQGLSLRDMWLTYLGLEEFDQQQPLKLCPLHLIMLYEEFPEQSAEEELLTSNYEAARNSVRIRNASCAVSGCKTLRPRDEHCLHLSPTRPDMLKLWLDNMQMPYDENERYKFRVCGRHFESNCIVEKARRLKPWSVPTLELPMPPVHLNPTEEQWQHMNEQLSALQALEANVELTDVQKKKQIRNIKYAMQNYVIQKQENDQGLEDEQEQEVEQEDDQEQEGLQIKLEPQVKQEPQPLYYDNYYEQQPQEMQELEVLLEVGHVEKCTTYEQMDTAPSISYAEQSSHIPSYPSHPLGSGATNGSNSRYSARNCSVQGCGVTVLDVDGNLKLHKFPTAIDAMEKWMHNTQVDVDINFAWRFRICSQHFVAECFNGSRIRRGAMPTLRLGPRRPARIYDNEFNVQQEPTTESAVEEQALLPAGDSKLDIKMRLPCPGPPRKSSKYCQIDGCSNHLTSENLTLHKFPHSADMCAKWQHNTQVPFDPEYRWRYRICSAHFEPICLGNMRLVQGSVPTLKLGPRAPKQLFDNDFSVAGLRSDKDMHSEQTFTVKHEQAQPFEEDDSVQAQEQEAEQEQDFSMLEPELQLHEGQEEEEDEDNYLNCNNNWNEGSIKQEKCSENSFYNPVKSGYDKCSLIHCQRQRSQHGVHIYKFPRSRQLQQHWMHNLRIRYDERRPWKTMICSAHFETRCIRLRKLRPWAVPTLELGDNVPEQLYTNEQSQQQMEVGSEGEADGYDYDVEDTLLEDYNDDYEDNGSEQLHAEPQLKQERESRCDPCPPSAQLQPWKIKQCCLPHCRRPRGDGIKLFRLPNNSGAIRKWEQATGMRFFASQRNTKLICSRHFDPQVIGVRRLFTNAVPTRNLGPNIEEPELPELPESTPRCCITDCEHNGIVKLHKFPSGKP